MHFIIYITVYAAMVACIDIRRRWLEREHLTPCQDVHMVRPGVLGHVYIPDRTAKILEECACSDIRYRWWSPIFLNIHIWQPHFSVCHSPTSYIL